MAQCEHQLPDQVANYQGEDQKNDIQYECADPLTESSQLDSCGAYQILPAPSTRSAIAHVAAGAIGAGQCRTAVAAELGLGRTGLPADGALPLSDQFGRAVGAEPNAGFIVMAA